MSILLETKRLTLKAPELSDLDKLVALRSDFEVMKDTGEGGAQTQEQVQDYLDFALSYQKKHGMGFYLVFEKESGHFVGEAGLFHLLFDDTQPEIEIGYHLHKQFWGKGYATELTKALAHWGFQHLLINKIVAAAYPHQTASQKVLQKSGFDFKGKKQTPDGTEFFWYELYKYKEVEQWGCTYLSSHGYTLKNNQPEQVQITPWSYVARFITSDGYIYLKHTPELIALEPLIIQMLQKQLHASVPQIIARNAELRCFLMKDSGRPLRELLKKQFDETLLCKAVDQFTSLQLATANYIDDLLGIGVPDWRLDKLPDLYKELLEQKELLIADGLSEQEIKTLITLIPKVSHLCEQLDKYAIQQTMVQPDFNDNNTLIDEQLQLTTIDLGEIVIAHPFFSLLNGLLQIKKHHGLVEEDEAYLRIKKVCFKKFIHTDSLEQVLAIAEILWIVYWALSHYRLMLACGIEQIMAVQRGRLCDSLKSLLMSCRT